ncbi:hypothetical protein AX15_004564 [Amanita polypyramis BW_CC]|nr:hypothetical protein AX15_004564 [Amanita polypyramis BW_CC]
MIDGETKHKTGLAKGNTASWTESFYFDALSSSMLECRFYAKNIIKDKFIGGTKDVIELLLAQGMDGTITRELCKYDSQGNQRKTQIVLQFTIAATSKASNAAGLNMKEDIAEAKDALVQIKLVLSSIKPMQGAVNTSVEVVANIKSLATTWGPLLHKLKLFTEFVDGITRVHPYANIYGVEHPLCCA